MGMADKIDAKLRAAFAVTELVVVDDSEAHRGHAGFQEGGESHFQVTIAAPEFAPMSRIARHRAVHAALGTEVMDRIHALALTIR
ncbi:MAG: BolA family protein [Pseudomonadota bacterium]